MLRNLILASILLGSLNLYAQDIVIEQLQGIRSNMANEGYSEYAGTEYLNLNQGETYDFRIQLDASQRYNIWGACDGDCKDLDFTLLDAYGNMVDEDLLEDDLPLIDPVAPSTGPYTLRVTMHDCSIEPCKTGISFYSQPVAGSNNTANGIMGGTPANTDNSPRGVVDQQLRSLEGNIRGSGMTRFKETEYLWLNEDETKTFEVRLTAGQAYQIWGACDGDCSDVDLTLLDLYGNQIDEDVLDDDKPLLDQPVPQTGNYLISVRMYECSAEPCLVGVNFFGQ